MSDSPEKDVPVPLKEPSPSVPIYIPRDTIKEMIRKVDGTETKPPK